MRHHKTTLEPGSAFLNKLLAKIIKYAKKNRLCFYVAYQYNWDSWNVSLDTTGGEIVFGEIVFFGSGKTYNQALRNLEEGLKLKQA